LTLLISPQPVPRSPGRRVSTSIHALVAINALARCILSCKRAAGLIALALTVAACSTPDAKVGSGNGPLGLGGPATAGKPAVTSAASEDSGAAGRDGADSEDPPVFDRRNNIYFTQGSAAIDGAGRETIRQHAEKLKGDRRLTVTLIAYPADRGSTEYKIALGQKRVDAVAEELRTSGAASGQIRKQSYGSQQAERCKTESCRQLDRRVELLYLGLKSPATRRAP